MLAERLFYRLLSAIAFRSRTILLRWRKRRDLAHRWRLVRQGLRRNHRAILSCRSFGARGRPLIAIVQIEHFGDIVACEPAYRYIKSQHPDGFIVWITRREYRPLLAAHPVIDAVLEVNCLTEARFLTERETFDRVYNLHVNLRQCSWFHTEWQRSDGDPMITVGNYFDYGALLEAFSQAAGLPRLHEQPRLGTNDSKSPVSYLGPHAEPYVVIHATTNEPDRDWRPEKWTELLRDLNLRPGISVVEVGLAPTLAGHARVIDLCGKLDLPQLANVIRGASLFIGLDSGPAHFANAVKCPSVILLGRYRKWRRYMPYTGFLNEHAATMLLQWDGPAADIPVATCIKRARMVAPSLFAP